MKRSNHLNKTSHLAVSPPDINSPCMCMHVKRLPTIGQINDKVLICVRPNFSKLISLNLANNLMPARDRHVCLT